MGLVATLVQVMLMSVAALSPAPASAQQPADCPDKCGDISIPCPFGIGARSGPSFGFELVCNHSYNPPCLTFFPLLPTPTSVLARAPAEPRKADGEAVTLVNAYRERSRNSTAGLDDNRNLTTYLSLLAAPPTSRREIEEPAILFITICTSYIHLYG
jgi:hypothetical protein